MGTSIGGTCTKNKFKIHYKNLINNSLNQIIQN